MSKKKQQDPRESEFIEFIKERSQEDFQKRLKGAERKTITQVAKTVAFLGPFEELLENLKEVKFEVPAYKPKQKVSCKRHLNVMWSDHHYGANLDPRCNKIPFGTIEETRRMAALCKQIASYKRHYRDETTLNIHLIGDMIQGKLHDAESGALLTEQVDRAFWAITNAIFFLAGQFPEVVIRTAVGNHGRDVRRHPDRATNDKYDSIEFQLYRSIKAVVESNCPNVTMETETMPYYIYEQFGMRGLMSHGDTVFNPGYPNKMVNVSNLRAQINEFNAQEDQHVQLFGFGHVHTAMDVDLGNAMVITNGCLIPTDEYALSIGIFTTPCKQQMWETVEGHMFGDHRKMDVTVADDKDASLDQIIKPWDSRYKSRFPKSPAQYQKAKKK